MESFFSHLEQTVSAFLQSSKGLPIPLLILLAFGGGLVSSLTPCVLAMLPLILSYIGVAKITSRTDALKKSSLFCFGSALTYGLMGLFTSFANFIMVDYRGYVHVIVGIFILLMSLSVLEVIKLPLPQFMKRIPVGGPLLIGIAFALVGSPCASAILFATLAMSAASGSLIGSVLVMGAYSLGYTGLPFVASLFEGIIKQLDYFKKHSKVLTIISSIILAFLGGVYLLSGIKWFFS